jgi:hypothetical protein
VAAKEAQPEASDAARSKGSGKREREPSAGRDAKRRKSEGKAAAEAAADWVAWSALAGGAAQLVRALKSAGDTQGLSSLGTLAHHRGQFLLSRAPNILAGLAGLNALCQGLQALLQFGCGHVSTLSEVLHCMRRRVQADRGRDGRAQAASGESGCDGPAPL